MISTQSSPLLKRANPCRAPTCCLQAASSCKLDSSQKMLAGCNRERVLVMCSDQRLSDPESQSNTSSPNGNCDGSQQPDFIKKYVQQLTSSKQNSVQNDSNEQLYQGIDISQASQLSNRTISSIASGLVTSATINDGRKLQLHNGGQQQPTQPESPQNSNNISQASVHRAESANSGSSLENDSVQQPPVPPPLSQYATQPSSPVQQPSSQDYTQRPQSPPSLFPGPPISSQFTRSAQPPTTQSYPAQRSTSPTTPTQPGPSSLVSKPYFKQSVANLNVSAAKGPSASAADSKPVTVTEEGLQMTMKQLLNSKTAAMKRLSEAVQRSDQLNYELQQQDNIIDSFLLQTTALNKEFNKLHGMLEKVSKANSPITPSTPLFTELQEQVVALKTQVEQHRELLRENEQTELRVSWRGVANKVVLMGSYDKWAKGVEMAVEAYESDHVTATFQASLKLRPGKYLFKLRVDDTWRLLDGFPKEQDGEAENSVVVIVPNSASLITSQAPSQ